ncbi:permease [Amycolatopsis sp. NPDC051371]|uniref:permease n=1 Tax=Amycolatopsis sp. NPDC051371 TaxID=3155800 RepID=UPI003437928B
MAGSMLWEILWALILGFALSAVVQAVVRKSAVVRLLGDDRPRTWLWRLDAAASSCSHAARAGWLALPQRRPLAAAIVFEIGSTNLVVADRGLPSRSPGHLDRLEHTLADWSTP